MVPTPGIRWEILSGVGLNACVHCVMCSPYGPFPILFHGDPFYCSLSVRERSRFDIPEFVLQRSQQTCSCVVVYDTHFQRIWGCLAGSTISK